VKTVSAARPAVVNVFFMMSTFITAPNPGLRTTARVWVVGVASVFGEVRVSILRSMLRLVFEGAPVHLSIIRVRNSDSSVRALIKPV
jgi:hypothetical protein